MSDTMVSLMKVSDDRNVSMGVFFLFILVCGVCVCVLVDVHMYMCAHVYGGQRLTKMSFLGLYSPFFLRWSVVSGICLSRPPQREGFKHVPPLLYMGSGN